MDLTAALILVACNLVIFGVAWAAYSDGRRRSDARFEADMAKLRERSSELYVDPYFGELKALD